ncbi:hypothetical protein Hanom_Chr03g00259541 [Helianthus anomalus]
MESTGRMKMAKFQTFWIQLRKNKPLDESRKTDQTSGTNMTFYSKLKNKINVMLQILLIYYYLHQHQINVLPVSLKVVLYPLTKPLLFCHEMHSQNNVHMD